MTPTLRDWYHFITEKERRAIVARFPGSMEYGLTKTFNGLSEAAKEAVRKAHKESEGQCAS